MEQQIKKINEALSQIKKEFDEKVRALSEYVEDSLERADERSYKRDEYGYYVSNAFYEGMTCAFDSIKDKINEIFTDVEA